MTAATTAGALCLQGGRELTPPCREMDRAVLDLTTGAVVVLAGAARPGSDYAGASERTVAYYRSLGADVNVVTDPRAGASQALDELTDDVGLIVMPGGAPGGLLDVLTVLDGGSIGRRVVELWHAGTCISGASAGAMVMCARTAAPDRSSGTADGLGLVAGMAIPHWSMGSERRWGLDASPLWGLPECGGVIVENTHLTAVGQGDPSVRIDGRWHPVSRSGTDQLPTA
jgi:cyanophycinase-like exopeptidase